MSPYEMLYEKQCRTAICWSEVGKEKLIKYMDLVRSNYLQITIDKVKMIQNRLNAVQDQ